jgi:integrase
MPLLGSYPNLQRRRHLGHWQLVLARPPSKAKASETPHLDLEQANRMLGLVRGDRLKPAVVCGLAGGLRIAEVSRLRWRDVQMDDGVLIVRGSWWGPTKSGKPRTVTLPRTLVPGLRRWKLRQAEEMLALGMPQDEDDHVITDEAGEAMNPGALRRAFGQFCERHGSRSHSTGLRHSATIIMLRAGLDVRTIADRLGHSTPELIFSTYSHWVAAADREAAERVAAVLTGG